MREVKFLITCITSAVYASSWWFVFTVKMELMALPIISSVILLLLAIEYVRRNWNRGNGKY